jgi:hypothetical protein
VDFLSVCVCVLFSLSLLLFFLFFFFFQVRSSDMDLIYFFLLLFLSFSNFFQDLTNPILLNAIKGETHLPNFTHNSWISYNIVLIELQPFLL